MNDSIRKRKTSNITEGLRTKNWPPWTDRRREQRHGSPPLPSTPPRWWSHTSASCSGSKLRPSYRTGRSQTPGWSVEKKNHVQESRLKSIIKCFLSGLCICIFVFSVLSFWYSWVVITHLPKFQTHMGYMYRVGNIKTIFSNFWKLIFHFLKHNYKQTDYFVVFKLPYSWRNILQWLTKGHVYTGTWCHQSGIALAWISTIDPTKNISN